MIFSILNPNIPLYVIIAIFVGFIISITFHELAHALMADKLGDPTPRNNGRVTLNPAAHFDPIGFLAIMFLPIGWAKPVPVNPLNFQNPRFGDALSTIVGPLANLFLIILAVFFVKVIQIPTIGANLPYKEMYNVAEAFIGLNIGLFIFNLFPIPPLDGYHFISNFFPTKIRDTIDDFFYRQGFIVSLIFLFLVVQLLSPVINVAYSIMNRFISSFL